MELLRQKIEELYKYNQNWIQDVKAGIEDESVDVDIELKNKYYEFYNALRQALKTDGQAAEELIYRYIDFSKGEDWVLDYVKSSLQVFYCLAPFRQLLKENKINGREVIDYFLSNAIVRFDPQFANSYLQYGFESSTEFWKVARALDGVIGFYISRHYTQGAMLHDLKDETELADDLCQYIVEKIEDNYRTLQLNTMIDLAQ